ncbi:glycyl-tRNA synthetase subunit beta [Niallia circulans]|uniref:glycine--tRNA ligase subunit beta n=1 Tax=Niallia circulans TaxID=1397 RepID=UPI00077C5BA1|nr:glycine--tRNA ligase subunit beta [Niallia circulans]MDR4314352.1 glycine--tRNA ligase subunit beta [Niallia circulans]MED3839436.1 glycine--tRNA ligase subunit beta [Niallia circulans]MED4242508.1 glycine--tRNA ligase subunit beta [Niallia circulans]MED4246486.1 glycine--tRNA ligase subunit beta [Niallia circulans]QKH62256.1 glycine--tRNA ligase subunit beta [Niallia circulans]
MNKRDLLLEIGLEEMPARFISASIQSLKEKMEAWLAEKQLGYASVQAFSSPRRLALLVTDLDESQQDMEEEAKGPAKRIALNEAGEWSKAAAGFTRGQGLTVEDIYFKEINGVEYAHVKKFIKGKQTSELLSELKELILSLTFPKNMRWANNELRYIRPIKWLIALFGEEIIPFSITNVETSNQSRGHRFLGGEIVFQNPSDYEKKMLAQYVMVNAAERKEAIVSQIKKLEEENNWIIPIDEDLLEEVTNLVEYPTALYGTFDESYLELPTEVLITSMKEHQRYFPVKSKEGKLLPYFVTVRNGDHQHLDKVARGNEKVLRARLADAAFFYKEDQKLAIDDLLKKLEAIVYHEEIGTLAEKVARVRLLASKLADELQLTSEEKQDVDRAAQIAKFDLVTNMVYEFPELQGLMGERYAIQKGEKASVANAINEHYMPRHADDETATSNVGAVLALAEKLDTIVSFFSIGLVPTGSQDPYALRRQATGIVQTLIDKNWNIPIEQLVELAIQAIENVSKVSGQELVDSVLSFFKLRVKYILQEQGIRYDMIDAVLAEKIGGAASVLRKAKVLELHKDDANFKEGIEALSRIINISNKAVTVSAVDSSLFENEYESDLYNRFTAVKEKINTKVEEKEYFELLFSLQEAISAYFDHTMVMADNEKIKENRLNLMVEIAAYIKGFASVNEIIVK